METRHRFLAIGLVTAAFISLVVVYLFWLTSAGSPVPAAVKSGRSARVTLQTVGALGSRYGHPDWVSYLAKEPHHDWTHSTNLVVPAHSVIRVTIYQYDSATGLRNNYFAQVQGTTGGTMQVDGRTTGVIDPDSTAHTFAIPQLGVYVPLPGVSAAATNACAEAPCGPSDAHRTITFTFRTKGKGHYRWQCFVPCGAGFVTGNGGPMQTFGYMAGFLTVV